MLQIVQIAEAVLYVTDLPRAREFYTRVLELPVSADFGDSCFLQTGESSTLILFDINALETRVSVIPAHGARGRGHVSLAVPPEEMDAWRAHLQAEGVTIEHEQDWPQGTHSIYFRDPDENSVELMDCRHYPHIWKRLQRARQTQVTD